MVFIETHSHPPNAPLQRKKIMVGLSSIPQWLEVLLGEKFFNPCLVHKREKKNEENIFCLDCCTSLCPHCLPSHQTHNLLQIRRYVYQDVIRLNDAEKIMDCSLVQSYTTNSAKVVFLNQRPMTRQFKGSGNICIMCDRNLQDPYLFCSISCKVNHMVSTKVGPRNQHFYECGNLLELENAQMTMNSILELPNSLRTSSGSSSSGLNNIGGLNFRTILCTANTEFVKKKRTTISVSRTQYRPICSPAAEIAVAMNRRKGVPHRSPMY